MSAAMGRKPRHESYSIAIRQSVWSYVDCPDRRSNDFRSQTWVDFKFTGSIERAELDCFAGVKSPS